MNPRNPENPEKEVEREAPKFKVTDRRSFTSEGERRDDRELDATESEGAEAEPSASSSGSIDTADDDFAATSFDPVAESASVPEAASPDDDAPPAESLGERDAFATDPTDPDRASVEDMGRELPKPQFLDLISMLATQAVVHLGDMSHPESGASKEDLQSAQLMIDFLELVAEKTKGNLDSQEEKVVTDVLYDLRMRFLTKAKVINL